tara:strand:- start:1297 stop:1968 length:672 start_codon:yes stop_codon:yes gene_type:complete
MSKLKTWSYSAATTFEKCPKHYYHIYVAKDVKTDPNQKHFLYGNEVHKAAELYVRDGVPLPEKFNMFQSILDKVKQIPGVKYCEYKIGLTKDLKKTGFFGDDVWWRGVIDLLVVDEDKKLATIIDYKTGKSSQYADTRQLSLMGVGVFKHFPEVETIKAALMFLVSKELIKEEYKVEKVDEMFEEWGKMIHRIDNAYDSNVFNAVPNFGCRWCPVASCAHNGK